MQKLSWREIYSGILVLLIGVIELILQISDILSSKAHDFTISNGSILIDKQELITHARSYITIIIGLLAGILLLVKKRFGWVIGMPLLLLFTIVSGEVAVQYAMVKDYTLDFKVPVGISFLLLVGSIFLLLPSAQEKYRVGKATWLPTLVLFMALIAVYWVL
jgi:hypothetical protein